MCVLDSSPSYSSVNLIASCLLTFSVVGNITGAMSHGPSCSELVSISLSNSYRYKLSSLLILSFQSVFPNVLSCHCMLSCTIEAQERHRRVVK